MSWLFILKTHLKYVDEDMSLQFVTWDESFRLTKYILVQNGKLYACIMFLTNPISDQLNLQYTFDID